MKIGWIGTGVMGASMVKKLMNNGHKAFIFNRTQAKTNELVSLGATFCQPQDIAKQCDIIFLMLGYPRDVEAMIFGKQGIVDHLSKNQVIVDHTTSSPNLAKSIYTQLQAKSIHSIDAPVTGGDVGARAGTLVTLCGGDRKIFDQIYSLLKCYSKNVQYFGQAGQGQHAKLSSQIMVASKMMGIVESLLYSHRQGLNLEQLFQTLKDGGGGSQVYTRLTPRILNNDFEPGFYVEHFIKDISLALEEAERANLCLPSLSMVKQFYIALQAQGGNRLGTQALIKVLEQMNGGLQVKNHVKK